MTATIAATTAPDTAAAPTARELSHAELMDENRLFSAHIDDLRAELSLKQEEAMMDRTERDIAKRALRRHQRRDADWSFTLENGDAVYVRFDGPGAKHPGCPPHGHASPSLHDTFFAQLRAAAAKALFAPAG